jgi:hypothetical protein
MSNLSSETVDVELEAGYDVLLESEDIGRN